MEITLEMITSLIGSLGFPIVCCIFLWKYINNTMREFTETMNKNTLMISKLCTSLEIRYDKEVGKDE